jgi:hypothetical protein
MAGRLIHDPSTPNPLKKREPELVKHLATFRARIGGILLDSLAPALADPKTRARRAPDVLEDLHAAGQVLSVLIKGRWTEQDLDTFDAYWRDAIRSDVFGEELECERHRIQTSVAAARTKLLAMMEAETTTTKAISKPPKATQHTLW